MKCRKCKAQLEAGAEACPSCGAQVKKSRRKLPVWAMALIITVAVLGTLAGAIAIWWAAVDVERFDEGWRLVLELFDPSENDVKYKDSYTVSAKKAMKWRDKVVASVGDEVLTNGELQVYYWKNIYDFLNNYGYYAVYAGLDYTKPLDEQKCLENDSTWQQFFVDDAIMGWHKYQAMALLAKAEGLELSEQMRSDLENLRSTMAKNAVDGGYTSIDAMLQYDMGPGCTYEDYYSYTETYFYGYAYFEEKYDAEEEKIDQKMIEAYFKEHEEELAEENITKESGLLYDVRHILIGVEGGTKDEGGNVTYSEEEWQACQKKAQELLDQWKAGDATEESFAALAKEHSADTGSNTNGGLYEDLDADTNFVKTFKEWYLAEGRKAGDYGLVKSEYGYHIMYFSGAEEEWIAASREGLLEEAANTIAMVAMDRYPLSVDYSKIVLGLVDLDKGKKS